MPDISMCLKTTLVFELKTQLSIADANKFIIFTLAHHHFLPLICSESDIYFFYIYFSCKLPSTPN